MPNHPKWNVEMCFASPFTNKIILMYSAGLPSDHRYKKTLLLRYKGRPTIHVISRIRVSGDEKTMNLDNNEHAHDNTL